MINFVRITSGIYRGRKITTPGGKTHPMGERERLALFNSITPYLPDAQVLDFFCGSGALGIEALSRGAQSVDFVDSSRKAIKTTQQNLADLQVDESKYHTFCTDFRNFQPDCHYDIILCDPPYDDFPIEILDYLFPLLSKQGIIVLSHPDSFVPAGANSTKRYAAANISIIKP